MKVEFHCLRENTERFITFSVPIENWVTRIDKNGEENTKIISYRLQFIVTGRFMASLSSILVANLGEGNVHVQCKCTNWSTCCLKYTNAKDDLIEQNFLSCNKNYQKKFG